MRKIFILLGLSFLSACASDCCYDERDTGCYYDYSNQDECYNEHNSRRSVTRNYSTRNYSDCNQGCGEQVRKVREPVEVIYKTTTYRTVYEPRTYSTTQYERKPYSGEVCENCR